MEHLPAKVTGGTVAEKPSLKEPKETKMNSTVHVQMVKMIPNKAKAARIAARKKREEEEAAKEAAKKNNKTKNATAAAQNAK